MKAKVIAWGRKHGPHPKSDVLVDVSGLPNPHLEPMLKFLTGHDHRVKLYVRADPFYMDVLKSAFDQLVEYVAANLHQELFTIVVRCHGGRHRSVVVASDLANLIKAVEEETSVVELETPWAK